MSPQPASRHLWDDFGWEGLRKLWRCRRCGVFRVQLKATVFIFQYPGEKRREVNIKQGVPPCRKRRR